MNQNNHVDQDEVRRLSEQYDNDVVLQLYIDFEGVDPTHSALLADGVNMQPPWRIPRKVAMITAIVGVMHNKRFDPNHPTTPEKIYNSAREACLTGTPNIHLYVRDEQGCNVLDPDLFHQVIDPLKEEFPEVVIDDCMVCEDPREWEAMKILLKEKLFETAPVNANATYNGDTFSYKPTHVMIEKYRLVRETGVIPQITFYPSIDVDHASRYLVRPGLLEKLYDSLLLYGLPGCSPMDDPVAVIHTLMNIYHQLKSTDPDRWVTVCAAGHAPSFATIQALLMGLNVKAGIGNVVWKCPHRNDKISSNTKQFTEACTVAGLLGRDAMTIRGYRDYMGLPQKTQYKEYGTMSSKIGLSNFEERQPSAKMLGGRTWVPNSVDNLTVKYFEVWDPAVPMHAHETEQVNIILDGKVLSRIEEEVYELCKDIIIRTPPNQPHGLEKKFSAEDFRMIQPILPKEGTMESLRVKTMGLEGWPTL